MHINMFVFKLALRYNKEKVKRGVKMGNRWKWSSIFLVLLIVIFMANSVNANWNNYLPSDFHRYNDTDSRLIYVENVIDRTLPSYTQDVNRVISEHWETIKEIRKGQEIIINTQRLLIATVVIEGIAIVALGIILYKHLKSHKK